MDDTEARSLVKSKDKSGYEVKSSAYKASFHLSIEVLR